MLLSFKEIIEMHKAGFIAIIIAFVFIIACIVLFIVRYKINKKNTVENPDEYLIRQTLKEDEQKLKDIPAIEEDEDDYYEIVAKDKQKKATNKEPQKIEQPEVKEEPKVEEVKQEEIKKEKKPRKTSAPIKEEIKQEVKVEEVKKEAKPKKVAQVKEESKEPQKEVKKEAKPKKLAPVKEEAKQEEIKESPSIEEKSKRTVTGKYEVFFDGTKYFYQLKASNGEVLAVSELYSSKDGVMNAIDAVKRNVSDGRVEVGKDKRGLYQFTLLAKNHRKLVMSANYPTQKGAISASESFKRFAADAQIVESKEQVTSLKEEIVVDKEKNNKKGGKIGVVQIGDRYYYQLKASNGEILISSDGYKSNELATNALETFKEAMNSGTYFIEKDKRGMHQFKIYSSSGRLIVASETYSSKQNALNACNSMLSFVKYATPLE